MDQYYLGLLSEDIRQYVGQLEAHCGFQLDVRIVPASTFLSCSIGPNAAIIITPDVASFQDAAVRHEVTHIYRRLVDGIPGLAPGNNTLGNADFEDWLSSFDNAVEHFYMIPEELSRYPERLEHWPPENIRRITSARRRRLF